MKVVSEGGEVMVIIWEGMDHQILVVEELATNVIDRDEAEADLVTDIEATLTEEAIKTMESPVQRHRRRRDAVETGVAIAIKAMLMVMGMGATTTRTIASDNKEYACAKN